MSRQFDENGIRDKYQNLTKLLIEKQWQITTMESATSGQIASLITDTEGASAIMRGAFITYSNEMKVMCGVPAKVIEKYSVYSKETAHEMARAAQEKMGSQIAVGVTGTMGNVDPENEEASTPGQVFYSLYLCGRIYDYEVSIPPQENRLLYKLAVAEAVYESLITFIC